MGTILEKLNPDYKKSSFQVNFDGSLLPTTEDRIRFLKLYAMYEDIIYRFSKGDDKEFRESISELKSETLASDKMKLIMFCLGIMFIISSYFMNSYFSFP